MKILVLYPYFCTPEGSWSTRFYEFGKRWVAKGHTVKVITAVYEKTDMVVTGPDPLNLEGMQIYVSRFGDNNRSSSLVRLLNTLAFTLYACRFAVFSKYDVLISSSGPLSMAIPLILAKKLRKVKTVFEVRDLWPAVAISLGKIRNSVVKRFLFTLERAAYLSSDLIVTASVGQKEYIQEHYNDLSIAVIPHGADVELFKTDKDFGKNRGDRRILLHLGSLGYIHNAKFWIEVAKHLDPKFYELVYIGTGIDEKRLKEYVTSLDLPHVRFEGLQKKKELYKYIADAHLSLISTLPGEEQSTCCPNKLFDSMAAGLPIVQTTTGWIGRLVEEKGIGLNVDVKDPADAAEKIKNYLESLEYKKAIQAMYDLANNEYNRAYLADKYLKQLIAI